MNRRNLLKHIGLGAGVGITAGNVKAENPDNLFHENSTKTIGKYEDTSTVRTAAETYAPEVMKELHERGYTSDPDSDSLALDVYETDRVGKLEPEAPYDAYGVAYYSNHGNPTPHIMISQTSESGAFGLYIQTAVDRAYAIITTDSGKKVIEEPSSDVGTQTHCPDEGCLNAYSQCDERYYCGELCEATCSWEDSCCDYEAIKEETYYNTETGECCCNYTTTVDCGTHHDDNWEVVVNCTDCYDNPGSAPCCG